MLAVRLILFLAMGLVILLMIGCPGLYDSKRSFAAHRSYYDAKQEYESKPSDQSRVALEQAQNGIEKVKQLDRRDILFFELFMIATLGLLLFLLVRASRPTSKRPPSYELTARTL